MYLLIFLFTVSNSVLSEKNKNIQENELNGTKSEDIENISNLSFISNDNEDSESNSNNQIESSSNNNDDQQVSSYSFTEEELSSVNQNEYESSSAYDNGEDSSSANSNGEDLSLDTISDSEEATDDLIPPDLPIQPEFPNGDDLKGILIYVFQNKTRCNFIREKYEYCLSHRDEKECQNQIYFEQVDVICSDVDNFYEDAKKGVQESRDIGIFTSVNISNLDFSRIITLTTLEGLQNDNFVGFYVDPMGYSSPYSQNPVEITIKGNNNVNYLSVVRCDIVVLDSPLNVETMYFTDCAIKSNSEKINVNRLIAPYTHFRYSNSINFDKIKIKQFSFLQNPKKGLSMKSYFPHNKISYEQDRMTLFTKEVNEKEFGSPFFSISYDSYEKFDIISGSNYFELHVENSSITRTKTINITIFDVLDAPYQAKLLDDSKYTVRLVTTGDWSGIKDQTKVIFSSFQDYVSLDNRCNSKVVIEKVENVNYQKTTTDGTIRDNEEIGFINLTNKNSTQIKNEIKEKFDNHSTNADNNKDVVITIESTDKPIVFENLDLKHYQYIKPSNNADVVLNDGKLNLLLEGDTKECKITVNNHEKVELAIKNQVESTIVIDTKAEENNNKKAVSIKSNSEIYQPINFVIGDNVESVKIDSINLHTAGSISVSKKDDPNADVSLVVETLTAQPQTECEIKNVVIDNSFTISQTASLNLEKVNLQKAKLNLNLVSYDLNDFQTPLLKGDLGARPSSITLTNPDEQKPIQGKDYLLFQGDFKDGCQNWAALIELKDTSFDSKKCNPLSGNQRLLEGGSLVVRYDNVEPKKGDDGKKLSGGQIAGIVVGCVAGVAIIVVVVIIVIKKKKQGNQDSNDEGVQNSNYL